MYMIYATLWSFAYEKCIDAKKDCINEPPQPFPLFHFVKLRLHFHFRTFIRRRK